MTFPALSNLEDSYSVFKNPVLSFFEKAFLDPSHHLCERRLRFNIIFTRRIFLKNHRLFTSRYLLLNYSTRPPFVKSRAEEKRGAKAPRLLFRYYFSFL